jgi:hypothetical protein
MGNWKRSGRKGYLKIKMGCCVHTMKVTGRSAALIPRIVKLKTSGGELSASCPGLFIPGRNPS